MSGSSSDAPDTGYSQDTGYRTEVAGYSIEDQYLKYTGIYGFSSILTLYRYKILIHGTHSKLRIDQP